MAGIVMLDTSIVSITLKTSKVHQDRADLIRSQIVGNVALISFITVAELLFWAESKGWGTARRADLDLKLRSYAILDPTRATSEIWAQTKQTMQSTGNPIQPHDLWIASSALEHDVELLVGDSDFNSVPGLKLRRL